MPSKLFLPSTFIQLPERNPIADNLLHLLMFSVMF